MNTQAPWRPRFSRRFLTGLMLLVMAAIVVLSRLPTPTTEAPPPIGTPQVAPPASWLPAHARWQHPSGAQVLWVQAEQLPMVDLRLDFPLPPAIEEAQYNCWILVHLMQSLEQGAPAAWGRLGAQTRYGCGPQSAWLGIRLIMDPRELDAVVEHIARQLAEPEWSLPALADARARWVADRVDPISSLAVPVLPGPPADLRALARRHARDFAPHSASLTLLGALSESGAHKLADRLWPVAANPPPALQPTAGSFDPRPRCGEVGRIPKPDTSTLLAVWLGVEWLRGRGVEVQVRPDVGGLVLVAPRAAGAQTALTIAELASPLELDRARGLLRARLMARLSSHQALLDFFAAAHRDGHDLEVLAGTWEEIDPAQVRNALAQAAEHTAPAAKACL